MRCGDQLAKVTIVIEDKNDEKGEPGLLIHWDSDDRESDDSLANQYAAAFIHEVINQAGYVKDMEETKTDNEGMN